MTQPFNYQQPITEPQKRSKAPIIATGIGAGVLGLVIGLIGGASSSTTVPVPGPTVTVSAAPTPGPTTTVTAEPEPAPTVTVTAKPKTEKSEKYKETTLVLEMVWSDYSKSERDSVCDTYNSSPDLFIDLLVNEMRQGGSPIDKNAAEDFFEDKC